MHEATASALSLRERLGILKELSKSGIVALVLISVVGGYLVGQPFERAFDFGGFLLTLFGVLFLAAGSSALNQYQDRFLDAEMPRTAKRPIPSGRLQEQEALVLSILMIVGGLLLLLPVNMAVVGLGLAALVSYNGLYTLWWKRHWAFAAVPGAIPGAIPILMGYAAARGSFWDPTGLWLFLILFFWQMPHFWSLAIRFREDYAKGGIPTLPVALGTEVTVTQIVIWCLGYVGLALAGPVMVPGLAMIYMIPTVLISGWLLFELRRFTQAPETKGWLRFFLGINFSLILYLGAAVVDLWHVYAVPFFKA